MRNDASQHRLKRAIPNEQFKLILEFHDSEYRMFDTLILYREKGWHQLAYPQHMKRFTVAEDEIVWPEGGAVSASDLHARSKPVSRDQLERQIIRLSYKNQAPTADDKRHHVYGVFLAPFSEKPFHIDESIGGGMAERGGGFNLSLSELLARPDWQYHFELAGCTWASALIETLASRPELMLEALIEEACARNGTAEDVYSGPRNQDNGLR